MSRSERTIDKGKGGRGVALDAGQLRALRQEQELTQEQLAECAGISTRSYQNAERGHRISRRLGYKITTVLGRPFATLVKPSTEDVRRQLDEAGFAPLPPPRGFAARGEELDQIRSAFGKGAGVRCCLSGPSGIGKTALALAAAAELETTFDGGIVWVTASRNRSEGDALATMAHIARALGFSHRLPPSEMVAFEAFCRAFLVRLFERRRLLILDDVESVETGRHFLGDEAIGWTLLTTTRRAVAEAFGAPEVSVGPLSDAASLELLTAHLGPERAHEDVEASSALIRLLGGVPRSILIASKVLCEERLTSLADYHQRIVALDCPELAQEEGRWLRSHDEASFGQSYAQIRRRLADRTWVFFGAVGVFEDALFSPRWAAAAGDVEPDEARHHLSLLVDTYLLREVRPPLLEGSAFLLDAQARRVANTIGSDTEPNVRKRLARFALEESRRIAGMDTSAGVQELTAALQTWRLCFNSMVSMVQPASDGAVLRSPDFNKPVVGPIEEPARLLPEVLVALANPLFIRSFPEAGAWFSAAIRVAHHLGDHLSEGQIAASLGRWWVMNGMSYERGEIFGTYGAELLCAVGAFEEAFRAQFYGACCCLAFRGLKSSIPANQRCIEIAEQGRLERRYLAQAHRSFGVTLGAYSRTHEEWCQAVESADQALVCCPDDTTLDQVVQSAALVDLAVLRALEGEPKPKGDLEAALEILTEIGTEDRLDRWILDGVRRFLGLSRGCPSRRLNTQQKKELIFAVEPEAQPRRFIKVYELVVSRAGLMSGRQKAKKTGLPRRNFVSGRAGLTELILGTPLEVELGHMLPLLYPVSILDDLFDEEGVALLQSFVETTADDEHPVFEVIAFLEEQTTPKTDLIPTDSVPAKLES